jgi:16S rRNA (adenine1518-N6/adenine1519-N6)-dimethyltransferase
VKKAELAALNSAPLKRPESDSHSIAPKKSLGQHFLRDLRVCDRIAASVPAKPEEPVVEIGPGEGALTQYLVPRFSNLTCIEVDPRAVAVIREKFPQAALIEQDFLTVPLDAWKEKPAHLCGNLPYYITSPILFQYLDNLSCFTSGVFMMQKEVADRLKAVPRTKDYGILSVQTQLKCSVECLFDVAPGAFYPPPKVWSTVVRLMPKAEQAEVSDLWLKRTVRTAFNQRRKTLRNSLKAGFGDAVEKAEHLRLERRAEELFPEEFVELACVLHG